MRLIDRIGGLSVQLHAAILATALLPLAIAGLVGIHYSIQALRDEMLAHLEQEVASRAETIARFMEQLSSEVLYLSASPALDQLLEHGSESARQQLEQNFAVFATAYPYIYQVRYLDAAGREQVRVDRTDDGVLVVPRGALQDKRDRYYFQESMLIDPGLIYVSPLDLNVEHGRVETPERPVVRVATPVADSADLASGLLIINLHADLFLRQIQQMAEAHGGTAYLFDRAGFYLARTGESSATQAFAMREVAELDTAIPRAVLERIIGGERGVTLIDKLVVAHAPIEVASLSGHQGTPPRAWSLALAYPQHRYFSAVFNLYLLYAGLVIALAATAFVGWTVSRRLLQRLVNARREQDRQMFQREKMTTLGELAMGLAHEIGNPLAGMKAVVQVLRQDEAPTPAMDKYLPRLEGEIDRLSDFLRTFHGFAAPQDHHPVACRLEDVLDDVLLWTAKEARQKGITIRHRQCGREIPPLLADPNQLKQLLLNLVINAIHAIEGPGEITLSMCNSPRDATPLAQGRRCVHFCVEDDGPGIPAAVRARIFEPFFTTRPDGSGLGLAVVKKIADQHGARIQVHDRVPRGTRFEFTWPAFGTEETAPDTQECKGEKQRQ